MNLFFLTYNQKAEKQKSRANTLLFYLAIKKLDNRIRGGYNIDKGTIAEFRAKVTDTHGNNKHAKMYNLAADMAELQILGEEYFDKLNTNKSEPF